MNQFPYLYPHSLSEAERLNEEELWQDNRDAEVSHTQLTEMFRHSDPAALMDEAEQAQLAELDDTVTVYRGVTTINSDNLLALSWTLDYETADWFARRFDEDGTVYKAQIDSKRSRSKIVHQSTCQHIQNVSVEDVGSFENLEDAYAAGYRLCRHCSPIAKLYRKESDVLQGYCQSHAASVFFKDRFIGISTPISDWRIIPSGKGNEVVLYHKNTLGDKKTGPVPGYHLQRVSQNTISGYLEYISDHDLYRNMHPLYPVQSKKNSPPPMKGTKRYRKEQKRAAKKARRQSIAHVLTLIENLDTQARVARSM